MRRIAILAALALAGCGASSDRVVTGPWGGRNLALQVTDAGATAAFKCGATGSVTEPLRLDASGNFDADGVYTPLLVQGGPRSARYVGSVSGSTMSLSVSLADGTIGPFDLTQGSPGSFDVCNF